MKLLHRMLAAPLACVAMLLAVGLASGYALVVVGDALEELYTEHFSRVVSAKTAESELLKVHASAYSLFSSLEGMKEAAINERLKGFDTQLDKIAAALKETASATQRDQALGQQYENVSQTVLKYRKAIDTAIDMATMDPNMGHSAMQTADAAFTKLGGEVAQLVATESSAATEGYKQAVSVKRIANVVCGGLLIGSIVVAVMLSLAMARAIAVPLQGAVDLAKRIADGDLSQTLVAQSNDEVGQLVSALGVMQKGLREMIARTSDTARELEAASFTMADVAKDVTNSVGLQSDALATAAAVTEQMAVSVAQVSDSADAVTHVAEDTSRTAKDGVHRLDQVTEEVRVVAQTIDSSSHSMGALLESTSQIGGIANVIREIADQTNLLALNAAIEAARAGESGRGFAVVADEVRKLAEKTSHATQDIKLVIDLIKQQSDSAVGEMNVARQRVDSGVALMNGLREPLTALESGASMALARMRDLCDATREQTTASHSIAQSVESIVRMGESNAESARSGQAAADKLKLLAGQLVGGISRFRV